MKIMLVEPQGLRPGHVSMYAKRLVSGFLRPENEIILVTTDGILEDWTEDYSVEHIIMAEHSRTVKSLITLKRFLSKGFGSKMNKVLDHLCYYITQKRALRIAMEKSIDTVHFLGAYAAESLAAAMLTGKKHNNIIVTIGNAFRKTDRNSMKKVSGFKNKLKYTVYERSKRYIAKHYKCVCHAAPVYDSLLENVDKPEKEAVVIPWGMELKECCATKQQARKQLGIDYDGLFFLLFGQMRNDKGYEFFFSTFKDNELAFKILLAGKPIDFDVQELMKQKKWQESVFAFSDYIPKENVPLFFIASDAIILPYKKEFINASGVLAHACEYQLPIIGINRGQIGDFIQKWDLGISFEPENPVQLQEAVRKFLSFNGNDINQIKDNTRKFVDFFSWKKVSQKHLAYYKS